MSLRMVASYSSNVSGWANGSVVSSLDEEGVSDFELDVDVVLGFFFDFEGIFVYVGADRSSR